MGLTQDTLRHNDDSEISINKPHREMIDTIKPPINRTNSYKTRISKQLLDCVTRIQLTPKEESIIDKDLKADSTPKDTQSRELDNSSQQSKPNWNLSKVDTYEDTSNSLIILMDKSEELSQSVNTNDIFKQNSPFGSDIDTDIKSVFQSRCQSLNITSNSIKSNLKNIIEDASFLNNTKIDFVLNYYKTGEDMRKSYIAKLICKKVWTPSHKEKTHNSIIIFDWDDTLLCTSFLSPNGLFNENMVLTEKEKEKIVKLEGCVFKLLSIAIEKGDVYIITNAEPGWVEYSAQRFYPCIIPILTKIKIVSARGEFEFKYPGDSRMWKIQAFLKTRKSFNSKLITNIICLGDSVFEMEAGHTLATQFTQAVFKTVKFREYPKLEELQKQLSLVAMQFNSIYVSPKNLSIKVEKKAKRV